MYGVWCILGNHSVCILFDYSLSYLFACLNNYTQSHNLLLCVPLPPRCLTLRRCCPGTAPTTTQPMFLRRPRTLFLWLQTLPPCLPVQSVFSRKGMCWTTTTCDLCLLLCEGCVVQTHPTLFLSFSLLFQFITFLLSPCVYFVSPYKGCQLNTVHNRQAPPFCRNSSTFLKNDVVVDRMYFSSLAT